MGILGTAASPGNMGRWEQRMKSPGRFQNYFYCDTWWSRGGSPAPAQCNVWKSEKCIGDSDNWGALWAEEIWSRPVRTTRLRMLIGTKFETLEMFTAN